MPKRFENHSNAPCVRAICRNHTVLPTECATRCLYQPIGHLRLLALFAQSKELLDLGLELGLQLPQPFVAHRFALGGIGMHLGPAQADLASCHLVAHPVDFTCNLARAVQLIQWKCTGW